MKSGEKTQIQTRPKRPVQKFSASDPCDAVPLLYLLPHQLLSPTTVRYFYAKLTAPRCRVLIPWQFLYQLRALILHVGNIIACPTHATHVEPAENISWIGPVTMLLLQHALCMVAVKRKSSIIYVGTVENLALFDFFSHMKF
jgi:hypothetical protein